MQATARQLDARPAIPQPYLSVAEAALRLKCNAGHLRRRCADEWFPNGLARKHNGAWVVHPLADPALRPEVATTFRDRDTRQIASMKLAAVAQSAIDVAMERRDIALGLDDFESHARNRADQIKSYLAHLKATGRVGPDATIRRVSQPSIYNWRKAYFAGGVESLIDGRAVQAGGEDTWGNAAREHLCNLILAGNSISVSVAYELTKGHAVRMGLADDPAWNLPALRTAQLWVRKNVDMATRVFANKGPNAALAYHFPKLARDYEAIPANHEWVGDERTLDIDIRVKTAKGWAVTREVKFTAWMDMRSRMVVGWELHRHADTNTILASLKRGIAAFGKPRLLRVDWGRDYRKAMGHQHTRRGKKQKRWDVKEFNGARIGNVIDQLSIEVQPASPYEPWSKPIESMFNGFKNRMDRMAASFCGGSPAERHEDRKAETKGRIHLLPTLDDARRIMERWIRVYHRRPHRGDGMFGYCPQVAMAEFRDTARMESVEALDVMFLEYIGPRTVRRDGVRYLNERYGVGDARMMALAGQKAKVLLGVHPDDMSRAYVCDLDKRILFAVDSASGVARSHRDIKRMMRQKNAWKRDQGLIARNARAYLTDSDPEELLDDMAAALHTDQSPPPATPPELKLITARPDLEASIAEAGPLARDPASTPRRTDIDDDIPIGLLDIDDDEMQSRPPIDIDDDDDDVGLGSDDWDDEDESIASPATADDDDDPLGLDPDGDDFNE